VRETLGIQAPLVQGESSLETRKPRGCRRPIAIHVRLAITLDARGKTLYSSCSAGSQLEYWTGLATFMGSSAICGNLQDLTL
jgi:hypothetical protein